MERKIRVLVVTYHPWREDISVGNTLSNIFKGMEDKLDFANIYIRDDKASTNIASRFFNISEKKLIRSIFTRKGVGKEILPVKPDEIKENFSRSYNKARQLRWDSLLFVQDLIGIWGKWKTPELDLFIRDYNPDIIFGPLGRMPIDNDIMTYISKQYKIPLIVYPWDDHYSLHKRSWSPIFWLKLFVERRHIRRCAEQSEYLYTITSWMQEEYKHYFGKPCKLLYKGYHFEKKPNKPLGDPLKIIYMGNIGAGRWKVLTKVVQAVNSINNKGEKLYELYIYTLSPKTPRIVKQLNIGSSQLMEPVASSALMETLQSADILLHVEPVKGMEWVMVGLSFSAKRVGYLVNAECILAVGGNTATMRYLVENDAGIVIFNENKIKDSLMKLTLERYKIVEYADKAWKCGYENHQISSIQSALLHDFITTINDYENR